MQQGLSPPGGGRRLADGPGSGHRDPVLRRVAPTFNEGQERQPSIRQLRTHTSPNREWIACCNLPAELHNRAAFLTQECSEQGRDGTKQCALIPAPGAHLEPIWSQFDSTGYHLDTWSHLDTTWTSYVDIPAAVASSKCFPLAEDLKAIVVPSHLSPKIINE